MRTALLLAAAVAALASCAAPPLPPAGPTTTVTVTATAPVSREPWRTCDEARQAWDRGEIAESSLIDGAAVIVKADGSTEFCKVKRPTRARYGAP